MLTASADSLISYIDKGESQPPIDEELQRDRYFLTSVGIAVIEPVSLNKDCQEPTVFYKGDEALVSIPVTQADGSLPVCLVTDDFIYFLFDDDYTENADFRLDIPDGYFLMNGEPLTGCTLNYLFSYTEKFVSEIPYTLSPASGATVGRIEDIILSVEEGHSLGFNFLYSAALTCGNKTSTLSCEQLNANELKLSSFYGISDEGDWTLTIPAMMLKYDGATLDTPIEAVYTVKDLGLPKPEITPAEGTFTDLAEFERFVLTLPEGSKVTLGEEGTYLCVLRGQRGYGFGIEYKLSLGDRPNEVILTPAASLEELPAGICVLTISPGAYHTPEASNSNYTFTYTYRPEGAVRELKEGERYTVVTLDGKTLLRSASALEVRRLPVGLPFILVKE